MANALEDEVFGQEDVQGYHHPRPLQLRDPCHQSALGLETLSEGFWGVGVAVLPQTLLPKVCKLVQLQAIGSPAKTAAGRWIDGPLTVAFLAAGSYKSCEVDLVAGVEA